MASKKLKQNVSLLLYFGIPLIGELTMLSWTAKALHTTPLDYGSAHDLWSMHASMLVYVLMLMQFMVLFLSLLFTNTSTECAPDQGCRGGRWMTCLELVTSLVFFVLVASSITFYQRAEVASAETQMALKIAPQLVMIQIAKEEKSNPSGRKVDQEDVMRTVVHSIFLRGGYESPDYILTRKGFHDYVQAMDACHVGLTKNCETAAEMRRTYTIDQSRGLLPMLKAVLNFKPYKGDGSIAIHTM